MGMTHYRRFVNFVHGVEFEVSWTRRSAVVMSGTDSAGRGNSMLWANCVSFVHTRHIR